MFDEVIRLVLLSRRYSYAVNEGYLVVQAPTRLHERKKVLALRRR